MKSNQKGFGAVEGLLIIIIVLLVGFIGYYAYNTKHNTDKTLTTAAAKTTPNSTTKVTTKSKTTTHTGQEAVTFTQTTYDNFLAALNKANSDSANTKPVAQVGLAAVKDNISADLYTKASAVTQATPFTCTAQFVTDKYTATLKSANPSTATVALSISNGGGSSTNGMTATVDLTTLKITTVTCPN